MIHSNGGIGSNLKVVIIESPYDQIESLDMQGLLMKIAALKIKGYRKVYRYGVLPVDTYDFISTHHLVCETHDGELEPIMGFKTITWDKCIAHSLAFPPLVAMRGAQARQHESALQELLDKYRNSPASISYGSSWTIAPKVRNSPELQAFLKDLFVAMLVSYEQEKLTRERVALGVPRVKTDRHFNAMGYRPLCHDKQELSTFPLASLVGDPVVTLHAQEYSPYAMELVDRYRQFWRDRIVLSANEGNDTQSQAA